MSAERRLYTRIAFHAPARLLLNERTIEVSILDLSLKGALVGLPDDTPVPVDISCTLDVALDEMGDRIRMETRIRHSEGRHVGLTCYSIDLDSVTHLRRLVELNLGDPALLERELSALIGD